MIIVRSFKEWEDELVKFKNKGNRIGLMAEDELIYDKKMTKFYRCASYSGCYMNFF